MKKNKTDLKIEKALKNMLAQRALVEKDLQTLSNELQTRQVMKLKMDGAIEALTQINA